MNELLQKHGCSTVFTVPDGLKELMSDITREVLRWQPARTLDFIANYLSAMLITREHGIMAVKILDDLCDCRPSVSEHLLQIGLDKSQADNLAAIIKEEIEGHKPILENENVKEMNILKKVLHQYPLDEEMSAKICQVARNAYRDYWYRKNMMKKAVKSEPDEPWEKAAQHTLEIYKKTKPSISELRRATEKIQAAYRGYHVRRNVLKHLTPGKQRKPTRKVELPGPPMDIASSREMDLGPVVQIKIKEDDVSVMFSEQEGEELGLKYDTKKTITHVPDAHRKETETHVYSAKVTNLPKLLTSAEDITVKSDRGMGKDRPIPEQYMAHHRISFAEKPSMILKTPDEEALEVPEIPGLNANAVEILAMEPPGAFEIPEELAGNTDSLSPRSVEDEEDQ